MTNVLIVNCTFHLPLQEPWNDLLFMNKIDLEITESVRCWMRHALGPQKKPAEGKMTGQWSDRSPETGTIPCGCSCEYEVNAVFWSHFIRL